jgi:glyoxylase-like metal-dependent hydrolase (beta-lactamase superfamily II)
MIHTLDLKFLGFENTIAAFVIESSEGPILIETGPHSTWKQLNKELNMIGFGVEEIKHVLVSHIHLDHAGAAWALAQKGAQIYMHPLGAPHLSDPSKLIASASKIYGEKMDYLWGSIEPIPANKITSVADGQVFSFGNLEIKAHHSPGHAVHHIAWQFNDNLFTGDVAGIGINGGPAVPPCPPPDIHVEDWLHSIQKLKDLNAKALYLTHFGKLENVGSHLDDLAQRLVLWTNLIRENWLAGMEIPDLIQLFRTETLRELKMAGVAESDLKSYDAANPADMSVNGILRYLIKSKELFRN